MAVKAGEATKSHQKKTYCVFWNPKELALQLTQLTPSEPPRRWTRQLETPWQWTSSSTYTFRVSNDLHPFWRLRKTIYELSSSNCGRAWGVLVFWNPRELAHQLTPSEPPKQWTRQPETPWQWRTEKPPNRTKKLPNVPSEILKN